LACGDQRRLTGNGSALEVVLHDYALYKSTFTLLYFTLLCSNSSSNSSSRYNSIHAVMSSYAGCFPDYSSHRRRVGSSIKAVVSCHIDRRSAEVRGAQVY